MLQRPKLRGTFDLDIFGVASERRLIAIKGRFKGVYSHSFYGDSEWVEDKYYILPLVDDWPINRFALCDMQSFSYGAEPR
jgi:hypothetical protein